MALTFQSLDEMLTSLLNEGSYVLYFAPLRLITITCHCLANSPFAISSSPAPLASFSLKGSPTTKKTIQRDTTIDCILSYFRVGTADPVGHHMVKQTKNKFVFFVSHSSMTLNNYGMSARLIEMGEIANETHRVINKQGKQKIEI